LLALASSYLEADSKGSDNDDNKCKMKKGKLDLIDSKSKKIRK